MKPSLLLCALASFGLTAPAFAEGHADMSFFLTSVGSGDGANLGGLEGADAHCTELAEASGISGKTWAAYLSTDSLSVHR